MMGGIFHFIQNAFSNCFDVPLDYSAGIRHWLSWDIAVAFALVIIIAAVFWKLAETLKRRDFLKAFFGFLIFLFGFWIYFLGFNEKGCTDNVLALGLRACMSSLEMFISKSDLIGVSDACKSNHLYMTMFSVIHAVAIFYSGYIAVSYLGIRLWSKIKLFLLYEVGRRKIKELNIFFGYNECSYNLGKDWFDEWNKNKSKGFTLFVNLQNQTHIGSGRFSINRVLEIFSSDMRRDILEKMRNIHATMVFATVDLSGLSENKGADADLLNDIGIPKADTLIRLAEKVNIFVISENVSENLNMATTICRIIDKQEEHKDKVKVYCQAHRESMNNIYQAVWSVRKDDNLLQITDNAYLAVSNIKKAKETDGNGKVKTVCFHLDDNRSVTAPKYKFHPVNYVDIDRARHVACTPFSCMVIGFGDTGKEAFKFLYEMGQLPIGTGDGLVSGFHGYIVDTEIAMRKTLFYQECPALKPKRENGNIRALGCVEFMEETPYDAKFWDRAEKLIEELNMIVISIGNDDKGMRLAVMLADLANRKGRSKHFDILVRSYEKGSEEKMEKLAELYPHIHVFGKSSELYRKNMFEDEMQQEALKFKKAYDELYGMINDKGNSEEKKKSEDEKPPSPLAKLYNKIRINSQNLANAYHRYTKLMLLSEKENRSGYDLPHELVAGIDDSRKNKYQDFMAKDLKSDIQYGMALDAVAQCEHLRWWAAHVCLGYTQMTALKYNSQDKDPTKRKSHNEGRMEHVCMVSWDELSIISHDKKEDDFKAYDRLVVAETLIETKP